jgi:hypothetical protein
LSEKYGKEPKIIFSTPQKYVTKLFRRYRINNQLPRDSKQSLRLFVDKLVGENFEKSVLSPLFQRAFCRCSSGIRRQQAECLHQLLCIELQLTQIFSPVHLTRN